VSDERPGRRPWSWLLPVVVSVCMVVLLAVVVIVAVSGQSFF
jgi:ABC-type phosphate transport system auxiliary subunit